MTIQNDKPTPASFRGLALGGVIFLGFVCLLAFSQDTIKRAGAALLFLPGKLGILDPVESGEIQSIDLSSKSTELEFSEAGYFFAYAYDIDTLGRTAEDRAWGRQPWLSAVHAEGDSPVPVQYVRRGIRPYDSPAVRGRPVFRFEIDEPGRYVFRYPSGYARIAVLPDNVTGKESRIGVMMLLQVGILAAPLVYLVVRRARSLAD